MQVARFSDEMRFFFAFVHPFGQIIGEHADLNAMLQGVVILTVQREQQGDDIFFLFDIVDERIESGFHFFVTKRTPALNRFKKRFNASDCVFK
ncbi:hypothetical protein D3C85_1616130 [compost metagenome]